MFRPIRVMGVRPFQGKPNAPKDGGVFRVWCYRTADARVAAGSRASEFARARMGFARPCSGMMNRSARRVSLSGV